MTASINDLDVAIKMYLSGDRIGEVLNSTTPAINPGVFYGRLHELGYENRGRLSRKIKISRNELLICNNCQKMKQAFHFSEHPGCQNGYDTSACKDCKTAKVSWAKVPIENKIFNRTKARAKAKNIKFDLTLDDIVLPEKCPVFDKPFVYGDPNWTYSIDRNNPELGYIKENVSIISNRANMIKSVATIDEIEKVKNWMSKIDFSIR